MDRVQSKRAWIGGGALVVAVIVAASWIFAISPERSSAQSHRDEAANTQLAASVLQAKVHALQIQSSHLPRYTAELNAALLTLPFNSGLPAFTRQLSSQARREHVDITSITVGTVAPATPPPAAPVDGVSTSPTTNTPSAGADAGQPGDTSATAAAGAPASTAATDPASSATSDVWAVSVTVQANGTLHQQERLLNDIRLIGPRRALITSVQLSAAVTTNGTTSVDQSATGTVQLSVFFTPQSAQQVAQLKKLLYGG